MHQAPFEGLQPVIKLARGSAEDREIRNIDARRSLDDTSVCNSGHSINCERLRSSDKRGGHFADHR